MRKLIKSILILFAMVIVPPAIAGTCENINCDCSGIPSDFFQQSCFSHERALKSSCTTPSSDVSGYCALHGANAFPVDITLNVSQPVQVSRDLSVDDRKIDQLYWSIREDLSFVKNAAQKADFQSSRGVLSISKQNLEALFAAQRSVYKAWMSEGKERKAKRVWREYSQETYELAEYWHTYLRSILSASESNTGNSAYLRFNQTLAEFVAVLYEQAGFGFARAERYKLAAEAWKASSGISTNILGLLVLQNAELNDFERYKSQSTSRLHRATLYWLINSDEDDPSQKVQEAIEFASDDLLQDITTGSESAAQR